MFLVLDDSERRPKNSNKMKKVVNCRWIKSYKQAPNLKMVWCVNQNLLKRNKVKIATKISKSKDPMWLMSLYQRNLINKIR